MGRKPCCDKIGLKRGPWTVEEDQKLINFILNNGIHCWRLVPKLSGLLRCGKSCRLRWTNYLRPDLKRGALSETEENQIIELHSHLGNRWSKIASYFPGRTDNEIKNHWNTRIKKRLALLSLDPITHKPIDLEPEICDSKEGGHVQQSNNSDEQEENVEISTSENNPLQEFPRMEEKEDRINLGLDSNEALPLNGNGVVRGCSNVQPPTDPSTSCSTSISLEDTLNPSSVVEDSYIEGSDRYWADDIDSILSWEGFHHLEDIFSFGSCP